MLKRMKPNKAPGPDQICSRLLKAYCSPLAGLFCHLFNRSLSEHSVPSLWKSSIICPVAKKSNPTCNNDYRPVALTTRKALKGLFFPSFRRKSVCMLTHFSSTNPGITYIKYSNETVIMFTTNSQGQLQSVMDIFAEWCRQNCLGC